MRSIGRTADGRFTVRTAGGGSPGQRFYWDVKAVRADGDPLVVEKLHDVSADASKPAVGVTR
jgi:hypothetical protein